MFKLLSKKTKIMWILSFVFLLSPIDEIVLPYFGLVDELVLFVYASNCLLEDLKTIKGVKKLNQTL